MPRVASNPAYGSKCNRAGCRGRCRVIVSTPNDDGTIIARKRKCRACGSVKSTSEIDGDAVQVAKLLEFARQQVELDRQKREQATRSRALELAGLPERF